MEEQERLACSLQRGQQYQENPLSQLFSGLLLSFFFCSRRFLHICIRVFIKSMCVSSPSAVTRVLIIEALPSPRPAPRPWFPGPFLLPGPAPRRINQEALKSLNTSAYRGCRPSPCSINRCPRCLHTANQSGNRSYFTLYICLLLSLIIEPTFFKGFRTLILTLTL